MEFYLEMWRQRKSECNEKELWEAAYSEDYTFYEESMTGSFKLYQKSIYLFLVTVLDNEEIVQTSRPTRNIC